MRADKMNTQSDKVNAQRDERDDDEKDLEPLVPSEQDVEEGDEEQGAREQLPPAMPPAV
jgi:hypothetical protein